MNTIIFASRKGGSGKTTLAANLGAIAGKPSKPALLIDADPQGSLTLWHGLRGLETPALRPAGRSLPAAIKAAKDEGFAWAFVDTAPIKSATIAETIRLATLVVIPARPSVFDVAAVEETIDICRACRKPFAVVLNGAPPKRSDMESPLVTDVRGRLEKLRAPVWSGQISQRTTFAVAVAAGEAARELSADSAAAMEIAALWTAVQRSVGAIVGDRSSTAVMHKAA